MGRLIINIVVHCTATPQNVTVKNVMDYFFRPKAHGGAGWENPGYHYIIKRDGTIVRTQPESEPANGVYGYNKHAIHVAYLGGVTEDGKPYDTRSPEQRTSMLHLLLHLKMKHPTALIRGHRDFPRVHKACPSFDVCEWIEPEIQEYVRESE